jgi:hypothetical protein
MRGSQSEKSSGEAVGRFRWDLAYGELDIRFVTEWYQNSLIDFVGNLDGCMGLPSGLSCRSGSGIGSVSRERLNDRPSLTRRSPFLVHDSSAWGMTFPATRENLQRRRCPRIATGALCSPVRRKIAFGHIPSLASDRPEVNTAVK